MSTTRISRTKVPPDSVTGVEGYAVGDNGEYFAVGRRCRQNADGLCRRIGIG